MKRLLGSLVMVLGVSAAGCGDDSAAPVVEGSKEVVVVVKGVGNPWFDRLGEGVTDANADLATEASMVGPAPDTDSALEQIKIIEGLIERKVGAIGVVPQDPAGLEPVLQKARDAGIIVLTHEATDLVNADWNIETIDSTEFAEQIFQEAADQMGGEGKFGVFTGGAGHDFWVTTGKAYLEAKYPGKFTVVSTADPNTAVCGETGCEGATEELLTANPDLKGIVAFGSQGPIGAGRHLKKINNTDVAVVGAAIPSQAASFLKEGWVRATFIWDPAEPGYAMVSVAKRLLDGKTDLAANPDFPPVGTAVIDTGNRDILFDKILRVTKDNVDDMPF